MDWENITVTVVPDPCWSPEDEAAAQAWLSLIRYLERRATQDGAPGTLERPPSAGN